MGSGVARRGEVGGDQGRGGIVGICPVFFIVFSTFFAESEIWGVLGK